MPKIDPITGCEVMTFTEFLTEEGKRSGQEPHEVLDDIMASMRKDEEDTLSQWKKPEVALSMLLPAIKDEYETGISDREWCLNNNEPIDDKVLVNPESIQRVVFVNEATLHQTFRSTKGKLVAVVELKDGTTKKVTMTFYEFSGSRMEPPDSETSIEWSDA